MRQAAVTVAAFFDRLPARWRFAMFLLGTLVITAILTVISYSLYLVSGTAQLDLSRPGYKQALSEVAPSDSNDYSFSPTGPLNRQALDEFTTKYNSLIDQTKDYSAFDPNALSDEQLNLVPPSGTPAQPGTTTPANP